MPSATTPSLGPVSRTLLDQLIEVLNRKTSVVWVDAQANYSGFFDRLSDAQLSARRLAFRGSYLEMLPQLVEVTSGARLPATLLHAEGLTSQSIRETPLLQLYAVSHGFERALPTLIRQAATGRVMPDDVEAFLNEPDVTLERADAWMAARTSEASDAFATKLAGMPPGPVLLELLGVDPAHRQFHEDELKNGVKGVRHHFALHLGLPDAWMPNASLPALGDVVARWVMAVEYVHDLARPPKAAVLEPARGLSRPLVLACNEVARLLRDRAPTDYRTLALDFEDRALEDESEDASAADLGVIDTFAFEEQALRNDATEAIVQGDWDRAHTRAKERLAQDSVWIRLDRGRELCWTLVLACAELGLAIDRSTQGGQLDFAKMHSVSEAADAYAEHGAAVDLLHRKLEEAASTHLLEKLPDFDRIAEAVRVTREAWRRWADDRARAWTELCENEGALPGDRARCQRRIFYDVVEPLLESKAPGKTAYFMVDALRYEMAQDLLGHIGKPPGTNVHLKASLCELPSVTEVGMNILAPVANGNRLSPSFKGTKKAKDSVHRVTGWSAGGSRVSDPDSRTKAMTARIAAGGSAQLLSIEDVLATTDATTMKRRIAKADLVVVHSTRIDKAGENGIGLAEFPREIRRLKAAWERLREAGVRRFVISADHGFLLRRPGDATLSFGQHHDAKGRYAMYIEAFKHEHTYSVKMSSLDYDGAGEHVLVFPRGLEVFPPAQTRDYVHGGNSPQERVIPVLTIEHKSAAGGTDARFELDVRETSTIAGRHTLVAQVVPSQSSQLNLANPDDPVHIEIRPTREGVAIDLSEATGARIEEGMVVASLNTPFTVAFALRGPREERVTVALNAVSSTVRVDGTTTRARFDVLPAKRRTGEVAIAPVGAPPTEPGPDASWLDEVTDDGHRRALKHISEHGAINESELQQVLGHARAVRRFARAFDGYQALAPFTMTIESTGMGRTYRKIST